IDTGGGRLLSTVHGSNRYAAPRRLSQNLLHGLSGSQRLRRPSPPDAGGRRQGQGSPGPNPGLLSAARSLHQQRQVDEAGAVQQQDRLQDDDGDPEGRRRSLLSLIPE